MESHLIKLLNEEKLFKTILSIEMESSVFHSLYYKNSFIYLRLTIYNICSTQKEYIKDKTKSPNFNIFSWVK